MLVIDELGAQNQAVSDKEKVTKILRTLSKTFDAFAMSSSFGSNTFDEITIAVTAEMERAKNMCDGPHNSGFVARRSF